ncbi:MAG: hypothetical protein ACKPKO_35265, partial [Candidatus Fonsibacter sp.]
MDLVSGPEPHGADQLILRQATHRLPMPPGTDTATPTGDLLRRSGPTDATERDAAEPEQADTQHVLAPR